MSTKEVGGGHSKSSEAQTSPAKEPDKLGEPQPGDPKGPAPENPQGFFEQRNPEFVQARTGKDRRVSGTKDRRVAQRRPSTEPDSPAIKEMLPHKRKHK